VKDLNVLKKSLIIKNFLSSFLVALSVANAMGEMEDGVKKTMTLTIKELKDGYKKGYLEENGKLYSLHESPCFRTNDFKNLPDEDNREEIHT
jgi:hypothetical protein